MRPAAQGLFNLAGIVNSNTYGTHAVGQMYAFIYTQTVTATSLQL